jgi:hypothetical protein
MSKVLGRNFGAIVDVQVDGLNEMIKALELTGDPRTISKIRGRAALAAAKVTKPTVMRLAPVATQDSVDSGAIKGRLKRAIRYKLTQKDKEAAVVYIKPGKTRADTSGAYYRWVVVRGTRGTRDSQRRDRQAFYAPLQDRGYTRKARWRAARSAGLFVKLAVKPIAPRPFLDVAVALTKSAALQKYTEAYEQFIVNEAFKGLRK